MTQSVGFGEYRFQPDTGQLWFRGQEVRLTPKAAHVLKILVSNAGSPVSKADLFASVWSDVAVTDDALTTCIQELRRVLSDDAKRPQFIETRHRRGYQFIAAVSREKAQAPVAEARTARAISSIAVLPYADMSPGHDQEYLCEGLAEDLINALTQVDGLRQTLEVLPQVWVLHRLQFKLCQAPAGVVAPQPGQAVPVERPEFMFARDGHLRRHRLQVGVLLRQGIV